ncbi:hypothetical protein ACA106_05420 [Agrobacterium pusense]
MDVRRGLARNWLVSRYLAAHLCPDRRSLKTRPHPRALQFRHSHYEP